MSAAGIVLLSLASLAVTLLRRKRMRRRLAARVAARLADLGAAVPTSEPAAASPGGVR